MTTEQKIGTFIVFMIFLLLASLLVIDTANDMRMRDVCIASGGMPSASSGRWVCMPLPGAAK